MNISENPFKLDSSKYLLDLDYFNDTEYQKELEKHINELDDVIIPNDNIEGGAKKKKRTTKKLKHNNAEVESKKEKNNEEINLEEVSSKIDKLSKKIEDFTNKQ